MTTRLPDFVLVGAMRSGSTTLYRALADHPQVFMARGKEVRYFDRRYHLGADWYARHFDGAAPHQRVGEATPDYLFVPEALERMAADLPGVRALAILREPAARAYSHHRMEQSRGREPRSFAEAVDDELAGDAGRGYLARSTYAPQLERLHRLVGRARTHVLALEHLEADPASTFAAVCRFLEIEERAPATGARKVNEHFRVRSPLARRWARRLPPPLPDLVARVNHVRAPHEPMPPAIEALLRRHFAADRARTVDLAGWTADPWTAPDDEPR